MNQLLADVDECALIMPCRQADLHMLGCTQAH